MFPESVETQVSRVGGNAVGGGEVLAVGATPVLETLNWLPAGYGKYCNSLPRSNVNLNWYAWYTVKVESAAHSKRWFKPIILYSCTSAESSSRRWMVALKLHTPDILVAYFLYFLYQRVFEVEFLFFDLTFRLCRHNIQRQCRCLKMRQLGIFNSLVTSDVLRNTESVMSRWRIKKFCPNFLHSSFLSFFDRRIAHNMFVMLVIPKRLRGSGFVVSAA